jgi:hypothetical protein
LWIEGVGGWDVSEKDGVGPCVFLSLPRHTSPWVFELSNARGRNEVKEPTNA